MNVNIFVFGRENYFETLLNDGEKGALGLQTSVIDGEKVIFKKKDNNLIYFLPYNLTKEAFFSYLEGQSDLNITIYINSGHLPNDTTWREKGSSESVKCLSTEKRDAIFRKMVMDPLIIIMTLEKTSLAGEGEGEIVGYAEWVEILKCNKAKFYNDSLNQITKNHSVRIAEITLDNYTVLFVKENDYENKGEQLLNNILINNKWKYIEPKYVAVHALKHYIKDISQFKNKVKYICDFHHYTEHESKIDYEFCQLLLEFLKYFENKQSAEAKNNCEEIIKKIEELSKKIVLERLTLLKHRIITLWLPLAIDIQGLSEVNEDNAQNYFEKIKEDNYLNEIKYSINKQIDELNEILNGKKKINKGEKEYLNTLIGEFNTKSEIKDLNQEYLNQGDDLFLPKWLERFA